MRLSRLLSEILVALYSILCLAQPLLADTVYKFGVVPQYEARELSSIWSPIIDELEKRTNLKFNFTGSPRIPEFEKSFIAGEFDFAYMNPYHLLVASKTQGYIPLVRDGGRKLFGILVVKKGSKYKSPRDLEGEQIAFPAPNALGASLMMRAALTDKFGIEFTPIYSQTHSSSYLNVLLGKTAAAGGVKGTFNSQKKSRKDALKIIYETEKVAPHPLAAHPRVPEVHREAVKKALFDLFNTKMGQELLSKIPVLYPVEATIAEYEELGKLGLERFYEK